MPRLSNTGPKVDDWYNAHAGKYGSSTHDVCAHCAPGDGALIPPCPELQPYNPGEPVDLGWEEGAAHPCYSECDYRCAICTDRLTERDN